MKRKLIDALHENIRLMNISYLNGDPTMFEEVEAGAVLLEKKRVSKRDASIVSSQVSGDIVSIRTHEQMTQIDYVMLLERLIVQEDSSYVEERVVRRRAVFVKNKLQKDVRLIEACVPEKEEEIRKNTMMIPSARGEYDRRSAVRYAERWWNDYNPSFKQFEDNCTNFVSQCLLAGGAPMTSKTSKQRGWWYENNKSMSLSWSVAHSLRWYLSGARTGLREKRNIVQAIYYLVISSVMILTVLVNGIIMQLWWQKIGAMSL